MKNYKIMKKFYKIKKIKQIFITNISILILLTIYILFYFWLWFG